MEEAGVFCLGVTVAVASRPFRLSFLPVSFVFDFGFDVGFAGIHDSLTGKIGQNPRTSQRWSVAVSTTDAQVESAISEPARLTGRERRFAMVSWKPSTT
ncbi:hypothetical protein [Paraburkholderia sp. GAS448]|uniref:hypothetical protein n=1 Tax=Paraburkholderia sp. GAS448 TaxID=3035136 RepID=UPI003D25C207